MLEGSPLTEDSLWLGRVDKIGPLVEFVLLEANDLLLEPFGNVEVLAGGEELEDGAIFEDCEPAAVPKGAEEDEANRPVGATCELRDDDMFEEVEMPPDIARLVDVCDDKPL